MKNVAKCDTWCELQDPVNHRVFESCTGSLLAEGTSAWASSIAAPTTQLSPCGVVVKAGDTHCPSPRHRLYGLFHDPSNAAP
ncbi:uncharacterized protein E5676_scaffold148G00120 [Cucumis melo var. makuwa]|uniref:Uncharacterized protein n=1 Tax=Cucumis melo var. makuwa TaxID=1194695 RepID=A0A5A7U826_CUCMM|nr:uncharacterized protein E6C27_scaffold55G002400 [Cucumis melo var. makuwa]TYK04146.1 uncharacterized protein E5676_scaffold148G00120 [Cucumis melo var. makuwa]